MRRRGKPLPKPGSARTCLHFDSKALEIVFAESWLGRPVEGADPQVAGRARLALAQAALAAPMRFDEQVERVLHQVLMATRRSSQE